MECADYVTNAGRYAEWQKSVLLPSSIPILRAHST
jgi:hypothetical protein